MGKFCVEINKYNFCLVMLIGSFFLGRLTAPINCESCDEYQKEITRLRGKVDKLVEGFLKTTLHFAANCFAI